MFDMLDITNKDGISVIRFKNSDRFNALIAEPVKESILELYNVPGARVVFDLTGINFIDSSGFAVFLSAMKAANNKNGAFKICNVSPDVMELFKLLQLHNVFEIYSDLDSCLQSFSS